MRAPIVVRSRQFLGKVFVVAVVIALLTVPLLFIRSDRVAVSSGRIVDKRVAVSHSRWNGGVRYSLVLQTRGGETARVRVPADVYRKAVPGMWCERVDGQWRVTRR